MTQSCQANDGSIPHIGDVPNFQPSQEVPVGMKKNRQWLCARKVLVGDHLEYEYFLPSGTKVDPSEGRFASYKMCLEVKEEGGCDEIAFVFTEADPFVGIIIEKAIVEFGDGLTCADWAEPWYKSLRTYINHGLQGNDFQFVCFGSKPRYTHSIHFGPGQVIKVLGVNAPIVFGYGAPFPTYDLIADCNSVVDILLGRVD